MLVATSYNEPEKVDTLTEKTLSALYKRGRAGTGDLRRMTGGKSRSIRHRIDEYLIPNELVREINRREHAGNNERVYELTRDGQRLVEDQWSQLTHYAQRDEVLDASRETRKHVDQLHDRIDEFSRRLDRAESEIDRRLDRANTAHTNLKRDLKGDFSELREEVDELEGRVESVEDDINHLNRRMLNLEESVDEYDDRLGRIEQIAEEAWAWTVGRWVSDGEKEGLSHQKMKNNIKVILNNRSPSQLRFWNR